jgi:hypothetical protein
MTEITGITLEAKQNFTLILEDGSQAPLYMEYIDQNYGWNMSVSYPGWSGITYQRMTVNANMLRRWSNIIPFGLAIITNDGYEPILISDFYSGRASLFLLNADDVQTYETYLQSLSGIPR